MQQLGNRNIDDSFIGIRIEYVSEFDRVEEGNIKKLRWCGGVVENISDGTWVNPGKLCQCYKENEAAFVFWDSVPEANYPVSRSIEPFDENKRNNKIDGSWRKEFSAVYYEL